MNSFGKWLAIVFVGVGIAMGISITVGPVLAGCVSIMYGTCQGGNLLPFLIMLLIYTAILVFVVGAPVLMHIQEQDREIELLNEELSAYENQEEMIGNTHE